MKKLMSKRLFITYFILIITFIIIIAALFYLYNINMLKNNAMSNLYQFTQYTVNQVDMEIRTMDTITIDLAVNNELIKALKSLNSTDGDRTLNERIIKEIIINNYINKYHIYRISIFTENGDFFSTGVSSLNSKEIKQEIIKSNWKTDFNLQNGRKLMLSPHIDVWDKSKNQNVISLIRQIRDPINIVGYIEIQQNVETLQAVCQNWWNGNKLKIAIIDGNNNVFYSNFPSDGSNHYINEIITISKMYSYKTVDRKSSIISILDSNYNDWKVALILEKSILYGSLGYIRSITLSAVVLTILVSAVFIQMMTNRITKPLNILVKSIKNTKLDDLENISVSSSRNYEADLLNNTFIDMKSRLRESLNKEKIMQGLQTKVVFDTLQSKIGPHFLFNSLGSIANMCEEGDNGNAADACYCLSEILRYSSNYSKSIVILKDEVDNLNSYLSLMKKRYLHRLNYDINAADETFNIKIPKLILQPIVENAIRFSLIENEKVFLLIDIFINENKLNIKISDNGCGINDEKLNEINANYNDFVNNMHTYDISKNIKFGGMGLLSTLIRLYLYFGEAFKYKIYLNESEGTTVLFVIDNISYNEE